jgi:Uma2 family endonuclease
LATDLDEKKRLYHAMGIPEYWVIDEQGVRYLSSEEQADRERQAADRERCAKEEVEQQMLQEQQSRTRLEAYLRSQGIDPDQIPWPE